MTKLIFRTKGNSDPGKKPKVYFSCHPDDFEKTFDAVCEDIFQTHDCTIFYKEDMADELPEDTRETDLGSMNLFVFPVTFKLLRDATTARDTDLAFAKRERRPILPIMFEANGGQSILPIYSRPELFGERQFLAKFSSDLTEISYADKLKKYLDATLIDDQTAEKIRKAFDAYIFLSYRKKDRKYANELMRLIHSDPVCRDIAIWFDEFLMPGESFELSIEKALQKSKLFTLLVTPSLLETDAEGNKNYVQREEYPRAKASGLPILPAEKVPTDRKALASDYADLPEVVDANNEDGFRHAFLEAVQDIAKHEQVDDPMHNYLIGLAYLNGIDVEINIDYGVKLVTMAAEADLPEAMGKLYEIYQTNSYVNLDFRKSCEWAERLYLLYLKNDGQEDELTLQWHSRQAAVLMMAGEYTKAVNIIEQCYASQCLVLGEEHNDTLTSLNNLAAVYSKLGNYKKAAALLEKCFEVMCRLSHPEAYITLITLINLSSQFAQLGDYRKAIKLAEECYEIQCQTIGTENRETIFVINNLSSYYCLLGNYKKAAALGKQCYETQCRLLGKEHPQTLHTLNNLAQYIYLLGDPRKGVKLSEQCYESQCRILGEEHPDSLTTLNNLALRYSELGNNQKAIKLAKQAYVIQCSTLGIEHPNTIGLRGNLALYYHNLGDHQKAIQITEECYALSCKVLGKEHPDTLVNQLNLFSYYGNLGDYKKAAALGEKCYASHCRSLGKDHPQTLKTLNRLALQYSLLGNHRKAAILSEQSYTIHCKVFGNEAIETLKTLLFYATYTYKSHKGEKALNLFRRLFEILQRKLCIKYPQELAACKALLEHTNPSITMDPLAAKLKTLLARCLPQMSDF